MKHVAKLLSVVLLAVFACAGFATLPGCGEKAGKTAVQQTPGGQNADKAAEDASHRNARRAREKD